jgi:hypothetical protein
MIVHAIALLLTIKIILISYMSFGDSVDPGDVINATCSYILGYIGGICVFTYILSNTKEKR